MGFWVTIGIAALMFFVGLWLFWVRNNLLVRLIGLGAMTLVVWAGVGRFLEGDRFFAALWLILGGALMFVTSLSASRTTSGATESEVTPDSLQYRTLKSHAATGALLAGVGVVLLIGYTSTASAILNALQPSATLIGSALSVVIDNARLTAGELTR